jgi:hypothetical protein
MRQFSQPRLEWWTMPSSPIFPVTPLRTTISHELLKIASFGFNTELSTFSNIWNSRVNHVFVKWVWHVLHNLHDIMNGVWLPPTHLGLAERLEQRRPLNIAQNWKLFLAPRFLSAIIKLPKSKSLAAAARKRTEWSQHLQSRSFAAGRNWD